MGAFINLTGQRFGRLVAKAFLYRSNTKHAMWECLCDCENKTVVSLNNLHNGYVKSCGCWLKEFVKTVSFPKLPPGELHLNCLYSHAKKNAKKREINFNLTKEQYRSLSSQDCVYCGAKPTNHHMDKYIKTIYLHNGVDRIDNSLGYEIHNCAPCCKKCNSMKHNITYELAVKFIKLFEEKFGKPIK